MPDLRKRALDTNETPRQQQRKPRLENLPCWFTAYTAVSVTVLLLTDIHDRRARPAMKPCAHPRLIGFDGCLLSMHCPLSLNIYSTFPIVAFR